MQEVEKLLAPPESETCDMDSGMFTGSEDAENADSNSSNSTNPSPFLGRSLKR